MEEAASGVSYTHAPKRYALSGKIMLCAIVLLFNVVLLILALHIYARCFYHRRLRRNLRRHRSRILLDHHNNPSSAAARGLDAAVLASLPIFVFSSKTHHGVVLECAVCLCEFGEGEKGRVLPKCNHSFHIDCIDMWFLSHSTCPLCRSAVKSDTLVPLPLEDRGEMVVSVGREGDSETGASSSSSSSSSSGSGSGSGSDLFRKIEVPMRRGLVEMEIGDLKSPGSRILSLKRILSRDRRAGAFSCSSSSSGAEADLERGDEQLPQTQS